MMQASRARLFKEYKEVQRDKSGDSDIKLSCDDTNIFKWTALIKGPSETPYQEGVFQLAMTVPEQYPLVPPQVRFVTKIFHPNVHFKTGEICLDILKTAWSPAWTLQSVDATIPRDSRDRMNVEKQCLARDIVNIIACEGEERIERYEVAGKWRARMTMAGFSVYPLSANVKDTVKSLLHQSYCNSYKTKEEGGAMYFGWLDRILIAASAWH